ncbi:MAG: hypothetical protein R3260_14475 [Pseudomonas sp.]|nr:hypothetical protein [Pseudomonas sp.]
MTIVRAEPAMIHGLSAKALLNETLGMSTFTKIPTTATNTNTTTNTNTHQTEVTRQSNAMPASATYMTY